MSKKNTASRGSNFKSSFSKALAEAILQNENNEVASAITFADIKDTYRALCFDDPIVDNDLKCRALALKLINGAYSVDLDVDVELCKNTTLGLSDPLVRGVLSTTQRDHMTRETSNSSNKITEDSVQYRGEKIVDSSLASQGYAELAFVVLLLGPLQMVKYIVEVHHHGEEHNWTRSFLGSYSGEEIDTRESNKRKDNDVDHFLQNMSELKLDDRKESDNLIDLVSTSDIDPQDEDSIQEIFADESDPDDYDFGDDRYQAETISNTMFVLDAESLSKPQSLTNTQIQHRIQSLLNELSYKRLSTMSKKNWKMWGVSHVLCESTLSLLKCLDDVPGYGLEGLAMLHTKPLLVFRDRALDDRYGYDCFDDFIKLIKILLESESNHVGRKASKPQDGTLSPSQAIGLSSLSSLCSSMLSQRKNSVRLQSLRNFIMKLQDILVDCIESIRPTRKLADNSTLAPFRVLLGLIPLLDVIANSSIKILCAEEAQHIIQSGLMRELILLYIETSEMKSNSDEDKTTPTEPLTASFARRQLLRSILTMCSQSPTILLKYASRIPSLTKILYSEVFIESNIADCIIWYAILGCAHESKTPTILFKPSDTKSKDELFGICSSMFLKLCDALQLVIKQGAALKNDDDRFTSDFLWLIDFLQDCRYAMECMAEVGLENLNLSDGLSCILQSVNSMKLEKATVIKNQEERVDMNMKTNSSMFILNSEVIARIRKGCKHVILSFEELKLAKRSSSSNIISSKTD